MGETNVFMLRISIWFYTGKLYDSKRTHIFMHYFMCMYIVNECGQLFLPCIVWVWKFPEASPINISNVNFIYCWKLMQSFKNLSEIPLINHATLSWIRNVILSNWVYRYNMLLNVAKVNRMVRFKGLVCVRASATLFYRQILDKKCYWLLIFHLFAWTYDLGDWIFAL